ncbi:LytTR family DNA-binding domain-containing protein [Ideonella sp. DXS29W]|uniref:LytTR family DNA-binding domain-containing protein n=1 Tax=Ideonella lacteola TaxID=2984193 RepID=A0ABU9BLS5_9BURK
MQARDDLLQRYLAHRRAIEVTGWCLLFTLQIAANSLTLAVDVRRLALPFEPWEWITWEASSNLAWLVLVPAVAWVLQLRPLYLGVLRAHLPWHLAASLGISLLHVLAMVGLRKLVYRAQGAVYDFGHWPTELAYEALKDVRSYSLIVGIMLGYRLLLWRWQGEASVLQAPDDDERTEPGTSASAQPAASLSVPALELPNGPPNEQPNGPTTDPSLQSADQEPGIPEAVAAAPPERFLIKKLGKEFLLPTEEIEWVQACGNYVNLHRRQHDYPLRSTLATMERRLQAHGFVRVHRSYLANLAMVAVIEPTESGDARLRMADGTSTLPCSRTYLDALRERLRG